jgi:hypothetical protein
MISPGRFKHFDRIPVLTATQHTSILPPSVCRAGNYREVEMARKKDFRRWLLEAWEYSQMTPEERREREIQRIQAALKFLETPEQKRQREEAKRRRALAKIGLTPEEFDERVREFGRKFFREQE